MTYAEIKTELHAMRDKAKTDPDAVDQIRAKALVGKLTAMGISPRRVHLSLRQLGLSARKLEKPPLADRISPGPTR